MQTSNYSRNVSFTKRAWKAVSLFATFTLVLALFQGCKQDDTSSEPSIKTNPQVINNVAAEGNRYIVTVTSTSTWTANPTETWVEVEPSSNGNSLMVTVLANKDEDVRKADVVFQNSEGVTFTLRITQIGIEPALVVDKTSIPLEAKGGTATISVTTNIAWDWSNLSDWLTVELNENGDQITVKAPESPLFEERADTIFITPTDDKYIEEFSKKITVVQAANSYQLEVTSDRFTEGAVTIEATADDIIASLTANTAWTAVSDVDWITIDPAEGGATTDAAEVIIAVSENTESADRTGKVTFACGDQTVEFRITQRGAGLYLNISEDPIAVIDEAGSTTITYESNGTLTVVGSDSWLSGSAADGVLTINYETNTGTKREGTITVTASQEGFDDIVKTIPVSQMQQAINLSENGTANCYIVPQAGTYKINATIQGNGAETEFILPVKMNPNWGEIIWATDTTGIVSDVVYANDYLYFTTNGTPGNAVIGAIDKQVDKYGAEVKTVLWSWHLWFDNYNPEDPQHQYEIGGSTYALAATWMDRNLGALSDGTSGLEDDIQKSFGLMYQWGRKDPFPGAAQGSYSESIDGKDDNYGFGNYGTNAVIYYYYRALDETEPTTNGYQSSAGAIKTVSSLGEIVAENVQYAIEHPHIFIKGDKGYPYHWLHNNESGAADNYGHGSAMNPSDIRNPWGHLWGNSSDISSDVGQKSIYDPCPVGWQIPNGKNFGFITSHGDAAATGWGSIGPWRWNCIEAYDGWAEGTIIAPPLKEDGTDDGWNAAAASVFFPTFEGGFHFFTQDNNTNGGREEGGNQDAVIPGESETIFFPAAGLRNYVGTLVRNGSACHYHECQPRSNADETFNRYYGKGMQADVKGEFYWQYRSDYNQGACAVSVRCIKTPTF